MDINDILQKRGEVVAQMKHLNDSVEKEGRDFSSEEQTKFDAMDKDQIELKNRSDRMAKTEELFSASAHISSEPVRASVGSKFVNPYSTEDYANSFNSYARKGKSVLDASVLNALQVGTDSEGGYIVPEEFDTQLIQTLLDYNEIRQYANVITTASDRNIPVEASKGVATWTAEEAAYTESDAAFGTLVLGAHKLSRIIKVSEELLQDAFFNVEGYLAANFGETFGTAEELAFVAGNGSGKPSGIVYGASAGITASGAAAITSDELIDLYHSLTRPYRANAVFLINDSTAKMVRKLKDSDGQYLWQQGLQAGQPDLILGRPVVCSEAMPAATTGQRSVIFGDMRNYTIADRTGSVIQRLNELYAANGQIGFRMYKRTEGKVTNSAGLKALTQA